MLEAISSDIGILRIVVIALLIVIALVVGLGSAILWLWISARNQVQKTPREPMLICDTHGMYPARLSIQMDVEGFDAPVDYCPFCISERVAKKKVL